MKEQDARSAQDHDRVLADLNDPVEMVLEAIKGDDGWGTKAT